MIKSLRIFVIAVTLPAVAQASIIFTNLGAGQSYDVTQGNPVGNDFAGDNAGRKATRSRLRLAPHLSSIEVALVAVS